MSLKPTVALHGSLPVLQPEFYYSDVFLTPTRLDLDKLLADFAKCMLNGSDQYGIRGLSSNPTDQTGTPPDCSSFAIFKSCWMSSDWSFMHLRCLDAIGRVAFLHVLHRIFLGECVCFVDGEHPNFRRQRAQSYWSSTLEASLSYSNITMRLGALYGLYTFYMTQPTQLYKVTHMPVPLGASGCHNKLLGVSVLITTSSPNNVRRMPMLGGEK